MAGLSVINYDSLCVRVLAVVFSFVIVIVFHVYYNLSNSVSLHFEYENQQSNCAPPTQVNMFGFKDIESPQSPYSFYTVSPLYHFCSTHSLLYF